MRLAFCTNIPPDAAEGLRGRNHAIVERLRSEAHDVAVLFGPEDCLRRTPAAVARDFDVGLLCPNDLYEVRPDPDGRLRASMCALMLEQAGLPFLNSPLSRRFSGNKLLAYALMANRSLPQPVTWTLAQPSTLPWVPPGLIIKPVEGSGGRGVALVNDPAEAMRHADALGQPCLLQEFVPDARCIRVVATLARSVGRYEKRVPPGTVVAGISNSAEEVALPPRPDLDELAIRMVDACALDIAGVDILEDASGQLLALEVNANFGFFSRNKEILDAIIDCVNGKAPVSCNG